MEENRIEENRIAILLEYDFVLRKIGLNENRTKINQTLQKPMIQRTAMKIMIQ